MEEKQTKANTYHTNIRLPMDMYKKLEKIAETQERNISEQIRFIIKKYLESYE